MRSIKGVKGGKGKREGESGKGNEKEKFKSGNGSGLGHRKNKETEKGGTFQEEKARDRREETESWRHDWLEGCGAHLDCLPLAGVPPLPLHRRHLCWQGAKTRHVDPACLLFPEISAHGHAHLWSVSEEGHAEKKFLRG